MPITAVQGLWLRRRAQRLPGARGERSGTCGEGEELRLLAIGDSIIDGVGTGEVPRSLPVQFAAALAEALGRRVSWRVEGTTGHGVREVIERLESLPRDPEFDLVLVSVGVNDVTGLTPTRRWRRSLERLFAATQERWPQARIVFAGLPSMGHFPLPPQPLGFSLGLRAATLDRIAREVAADRANVLHVPTRIDPRVHEFASDGFHPSAESCNLWARELAGMLAGRTEAQPARTPATREPRSNEA